MSAPEQRQLNQSDLFSLLFSDSNRDLNEVLRLINEMNQENIDPFQQMQQETGMPDFSQISNQNEYGTAQSIMDLFTNNPQLAFMLEGGIL